MSAFLSSPGLPGADASGDVSSAAQDSRNPIEAGGETDTNQSCFVFRNFSLALSYGREVHRRRTCDRRCVMGR